MLNGPRRGNEEHREGRGPRCRVRDARDRLRAGAGLRGDVGGDEFQLPSPMPGLALEDGLTLLAASVGAAIAAYLALTGYAMLLGAAWRGGRAIPSALAALAPRGWTRVTATALGLSMSAGLAVPALAAEGGATHAPSAGWVAAPVSVMSTPRRLHLRSAGSRLTRGDRLSRQRAVRKCKCATGAEHRPGRPAAQQRHRNAPSKPRLLGRAHRHGTPSAYVVQPGDSLWRITEALSGPMQARPRSLRHGRNSTRRTVNRSATIRRSSTRASRSPSLRDSAHDRRRAGRHRRSCADLRYARTLHHLRRSAPAPVTSGAPSASANAVRRSRLRQARPPRRSHPPRVHGGENSPRDRLGRRRHQSPRPVDHPHPAHHALAATVAVTQGGLRRRAAKSQWRGCVCAG